MKIPALLFSLIVAQTCFAQFKLTKLDKNTIPKNIQYTGNIVQAVRWTDNTGEHIVVLTKTNITQNNIPGGGGADGALYAYHYLAADSAFKQTWRVADYVKDCSVDMFLYFVDKTFAVTDLNKDGKAEVWIMYKVSCQGDINPVPMKIIMYEDDKKFSVRGTSKVTESMGGEFTFDDAFKKAPVEFRQYATKLWKQHKAETWKQ